MLELKEPVRVADHTLLRLVDKGSYGEVWLACTTFGTFRAVKIIHRSGFTDSEPYERELRGIRSFEPISRSHPGFIPLLQIGQEQDYFYCVMEVGDDLRNGQTFSSEAYTPKTLERFRDNKVLAPEECLKLGLQLVDAVARLHDANLVHRDIKPANILFVHGYPKLADIGLVTDPNSATSLVGTLGFVPPEGTGKPQADVYALGKVLYECLTGLDRTRAPQLPRLDPEALSPPLFMELMAVIRRAIHPDPSCRYQTARALHGDLLVLANGASVLRLRALEGLWIRIKRFSKAAALVVAVLGTASYWHFKERSVREHEQQQRIGQQTASGMQDWDQLDYGGALGAFASALHGTDGHPPNDTDFRFITTLARMPRLIAVGWAGAPIHSLDIASDGSILSLGLQDGSYELRDFPTLKLRKSLQVGMEPILSCRFRGDGKVLALANMDDTICLMETGALRPRISWQTSKPTSIAFSATSNLLYAGSSSGILSAWHPEEQLPVFERQVASDAINGIASGKRFLALSSWDRSVVVFAADDLTHEQWKFKQLHAAYCVALSPDETLVAAGFDDGQAQVWSTETGAKVLPPLKHTRGITSISFSPDGMLLLTTSFEGYAKVWSTASGLQETTALPQAGHVRAARFAPDGRRIVVAGFDGSIRLWDLGGIMSPQKIPRGSTLLNNGVWASSVAHPPALALSSVNGLVTLPVSGEIKAIETSLNRNLLLIVIKSASDTWTIRGLAEKSSGFLPWVIERRGSQPVITTGADTFTLVMGRRVESFSWMEGSPVGLLDSPNDAVARVTPPDSGWGTVCTGTNVILFRGSARLILDHELKTSRAVMSPDGSSVVTCTLTKGMRPCYAQVWKVPSGELVSPRLRHSDGVQDAAWSKDGRLLVTVDEDGIGIIWNTASWVPVGRTLRHSDQILSVKIGGSPEMIATASADRTLRLWDLQTGLPLTPPLTMTFDVSSVSFLKDGLLATELEGDDWLWKLPHRASLTDLQRGKIALLMNGLDRTALDSAETVERWQTLHSALSEQTEASNEEISRWHQIQADLALVNQKHRLEEHHMRKVVEFYPKAYGASNQLANAIRRLRNSP